MSGFELTVDAYNLSIDSEVNNDDGTITGQTYTESSNIAEGWEGSEAFDGIPTVNQSWGTWHSATSVYNATTPYAYDGDEEIGGYSGEYITVDIGQNILATQIKIHPRRHGDPSVIEDRQPKKLSVLYSTDNSNWSELVSWSNLSNNDWYDGGWLNLTQSIDVVGRYFAVVVQESLGYSGVNIGECEIYGALHTSETQSTGGGGGGDPFIFSMF